MNLTPDVWLEALAALLLLVGAVFLLVGAPVSLTLADHGVSVVAG